MMFSCAFVTLPKDVLGLFNAVVSVSCSLVIICWGMDDVCGVSCAFVTFPNGVLGLCNAVVSVPCILVITCRERADLLALLFVRFSCVCFSVSHQVWFLAVLIPNICLQFYFDQIRGRILFEKMY